MPETLYLRVAPEPDCVSWVVLDEQGRRIGAGGDGTLADAAAAAGERKVVLLVPGPEVVSTQATLPASSQSRLRQMLPYSLEDALAHDVEKLFFAVGPRLESGAVSVAVVARERLETWLAALGEAGLRPQALYSDADGVPDTPGLLTLVIEGARIHGRRPGQPPFVLEALTLEQVLDLLGAEDEEAGDLRNILVYADEAARALHQEELAALRDRLTTADLRLLGDGVTARFAATLAHRPGTNLLQGPYAQRSNWGALLRPWRAAAALLVALGVLTIAGQGVEYLSLARADRALTEQVAQVCQQQLGAANLAACDAAVRRTLEQAGETVEGPGETFLSTMAAVAESRDAATRIEALSYRNRALDLQLVVPSVPALDEFGRKLAETRRFDVRIQSTSSTDAGVQSRVQVVEAAP